ncbi:uncharacterized protein [Dermacentor albipictus]|uniref:uncharacterized protein isoform X2 n=1 Tax=Dermacentor albipictus TaxID=60249 RepID=UPI0038FBFC37
MGPRKLYSICLEASRHNSSSQRGQGSDLGQQLQAYSPDKLPMQTEKMGSTGIAARRAWSRVPSWLPRSSSESLAPQDHVKEVKASRQPQCFGTSTTTPATTATTNPAVVRGLK